jgi:hypothetical protein
VARCRREAAPCDGGAGIRRYDARAKPLIDIHISNSWSRACAKRLKW